MGANVQSNAAVANPLGAGLSPAPHRAPDPANLLEVRDLVKWFPIYGGVISRVVANVKAVDGITFSIRRGETFGLVGESGCGKTTAARAIIRLTEPTSGRVFFDGQDLTAMRPVELRALRPRMQVVFQDPYGSLNPRLNLMDIVGEAVAVHGLAKGKAKEQLVRELLERVGLSAGYVRRYPHEFSGGQRQRIGIARALALNPTFLVCDEPVSALDVSIQSQILNLLEELRRDLGLTVLFIAHGLHVVKHVSNRVGVMYLGKLVEVASGATLYKEPLHPYTKALVSAIPIPDPSRKKQRIILEGDVPSPVNPPAGCRFHTRCREAQPICHEREPQAKDVGGDHQVWCHLA